MPLAVVTGISSGIGYALARLIANREGWDVRGLDAKEPRPGSFHSASKIHFCKCDVSSEEDVLKCARRLGSETPVDVLL
jgi:NAD(P)-dependent dehydrogenase (short-subunit alcohol dehydrogenase family)